MSKSVREEIGWIDRQMLKLVGWTNDPQAMVLADGLLDRRLILMAQQDRGYVVTDRRRVRR